MTTPTPKADKNLGQHFLHDQRVLQRITQACGAGPDTTVLEIGPGPGALTRHLLASGATVVAVEKDERFIPLLKELSTEFDNRLTVHHADALKTDFSALVPRGSLLAGNLPYNVGTEIVLSTLQTHGNYFPRATYLLQKEVVQRICAKPNAADWGRLGIWCALLADCHKLFDVPAGAFSPPPKVISSVVSIQALAEQRYEFSTKSLTRLLLATFTKRRKMLRSSLKGMITEEQMEALGIKPTDRPENLTAEQFCQLSNLL